MDLPQGLPKSWYVAGWPVLVPLLAWALLRGSWSRLGVNEQSHVYLGALVAIALLWTIGGRVGPVVHFHLLGETILYLMFSLPLAIVGMTLVAVATIVAGGGEWMAVAGRALVAGVLPVLVSHLVLRAAEARLKVVFSGLLMCGGSVRQPTFLIGSAIMAAKDPVKRLEGFVFA